jgi:hypothetical protein
MLKKNIHIFIAGLGLLWVGSRFIKTGYSYLYGVPVSPIAGYLCIAYGVFLICYSLFYKKKKRKEDNGDAGG